MLQHRTILQNSGDCESGVLQGGLVCDGNLRDIARQVGSGEKVGDWCEEILQDHRCQRIRTIREWQEGILQDSRDQGKRGHYKVKGRLRTFHNPAVLGWTVLQRQGQSCKQREGCVAKTGSIFNKQWEGSVSKMRAILQVVLCTAQLGSKAPAQARLSRAPAWKKSKPGRQWGLKLGSAWLKAPAAAWGESKGKGGRWRG